MRTPKRKRIPKPRHPSGLAFYAELKKAINYARTLVEERIVRHLEGFVRRAGFADDYAITDASPGGRINKTVKAIEAAWDRRYSLGRLEALASQNVRAASARQKEDLNRQRVAAVGVEFSSIADRGLSKAVAHHVAETVQLIKSLPVDYLQDVEKALLYGIRTGTRHEELAKDIDEVGGKATRRAALIARDQTLKAYGAINKLRQGNLGVEEYVWRTSGDERVRELHAERDGERFSWDEPAGDPDDPADGAYPGDAINCRCWAEPIFPETEPEDDEG